MDDKGLQQIKVARQRKTAAGKASSDAQPSRSAALLPVNSRKGADKISASERKTHFGEIYCGLDPQQATYESDRCVYCAEKANCNWHCPLHNAIPDYIRLVQEGKIIEAAELCHQTSSLPEICGRVCPQDRLCEGACTLKITRAQSLSVIWNATSPIPRWRWAGVPMSAKLFPVAKSGGDWRWACRVRVC